MNILLTGGQVIDPGHLNDHLDIHITNGKITAICPPGAPDNVTEKFDQIIDASNKIVTPGLIDMHVHLREPGYEYKETILSGCQAAACSGFTAICPMPNTNPVNDSPQVTKYITDKNVSAHSARVYPVAAISIGLRGQTLCDYGALKEAGAVAVTDDGLPVKNSLLMRRAMEGAKNAGLPVISHCEDLDLVGDGVINEGLTARKMGLTGIPNAAESIMVMRDIALCALTEAPLHIAHVSTAESVRAIREAKKHGLPVTAETAPHYFTLTDADVETYHTNAKMNPPLRSVADREAIREGLADGTIDVIATDHAPHSRDEKNADFTKAPNGIIGLETSVPLSLKLVETGVLSMEALIYKMASAPAHILGLKSGLKIGNPADITIFDPDTDYTIDASRFRSLSQNTPFDGWQVRGRAVLTMVGGVCVYNQIT